MKKSKIITLVIITSVLASCSKPEPKKNNKRVHMRSDTTAQYSRVNHSSGWFYAFRPYGTYHNGVYSHNGYYSSSISESSNVGRNATKSTAVRGGFGGRTTVSS